MKLASADRAIGEFLMSLTADQINACIHRLLGDEVVVTTATEITMGMFNTTYRLDLADGRSCALRVGPGALPQIFSNEQYLMRREHSLTPHLSAIAPLLPHVLGTDFTGVVLDRDYLLMDWIEGENWDQVKATLSREENDELWRDFGRQIKRIHATTGSFFGPPSPEQPFSSWGEAQICCAQGFESDAGRFGLEVGRFTRFRRCTELARTRLDEITIPHLLHGDPWQKNVLIRRDSSGIRIVGILDHDRGQWGDPMAEWVFQATNFPPAFWETYGERPTDESSKIRAKIYLGIITAQIILEAWRYKWDGHYFIERLDTLCGELEVQLTPPGTVVTDLPRP